MEIVKTPEIYDTIVKVMGTANLEADCFDGNLTVYAVKDWDHKWHDCLCIKNMDNVEANKNAPKMLYRTTKFQEIYYIDINTWSIVDHYDIYKYN